jgi:hypothetical protein
VALAKANPGGTSGPEVVTIHLAATNNAAVSKQGVPCGWVLLKTYKPSWTVLEGSYSVTADTTQRFSYSEDSSSNLGVGQSNSGKKDSFTEQGTNSSSSTSGEDFAKRGGKTSVRYCMRPSSFTRSTHISVAMATSAIRSARQVLQAAPSRSRPRRLRPLTACTSRPARLSVSPRRPPSSSRSDIPFPS